MNKVGIAIITGFTIATLIASSQAAPEYIVVNMGNYPTVTAAATDEANVGWFDGQDEDDIICTECFAAVELQHYLRKIKGDSGGEQIRIIDDNTVPAEGNIILIGNIQSNMVLRAWSNKLEIDESTFAELGTEGYIIKTRKGEPKNPQIMVIGSRSRVGTLYGVYGLLHRLGVRWLSPGEIGEEVPRKTLDSLPMLEVVDKPAFRIRGFHAWEYRGNPDFFNWMARNRMNYWCIENKDHPGLRKRGIQMNVPNGHALQDRFIGPDKQYPYNHPTFVGDEELPPDPYLVSPSYRGDADKDNQLSYSEAHLEWYGLSGGKRSFYIQGDCGDNFCSSNPYACDELMKKIVTELTEGQWQDAESINFWTLDGGKWCECESCKALGTPTDKTLLLVHRLCQEMKRAREEGRLKRDVYIFFTIYHETIPPPTKPLPDDFDYQYCIGTYYPINRCYVHTLNDPACTEYNARYAKSLKGWTTDPKRYYRGQLFIGEYYNVSGFNCLPIMYHRTMATDIPYYYKLGARYMHYMHVTTKNWGTSSLTNYQFARMLWNPYLDCQELLHDYLTNRYGLAADQMNNLYQKLDTALCNATPLKYRLSFLLNQGAEEIFPEKHVKYEETHFDTDDGPDLVEMVQAIDDCVAILTQVRAEDLPERVQARLAEDAGPLHYAANTIHFYDVLARMTMYMKEGRKGEAAKWLGEMKRLGETLEKDTESTKWSSSHANASNALTASRADSVYHRFLGEFEPLTELQIQDFTEDVPLTITGSEFLGGGMVLYGKGIRLHNKTYSEQGNYLYSKSTGHHRMKVGVRMKSVPITGITLKLFGMSCPAQGQSDVPFKILMNDQEIFSGIGSYPEGKLNNRSFEIPAIKLQTGINILQIENTVPDGPVGNRPWFGIDQVELKTTSKEVVYRSSLLIYRDPDSNEQPVKTLADWEKRRQEIVKGMEAVMGPLPERKNLLPFDIKLLETIETESFERRKVSLVMEKRHRVYAYLFIPKPLEKGQKVVAMLALHQTHPGGKEDSAGLSEDNDRSYGLELAKRGYVVLAPDYPSFGDDKDYDFKNDRYVSGTMKGIFNHMRCVDYLGTLEMVDPERIGVIGHSLGGHNAMFVGVFDTRLKVMVSSCGWTPFHDYYSGNIKGWAFERYMPRLRNIYKLDPDLVPFDFYEVIGALAPRAFFSVSPLYDDNFDVVGVKKAIPVAAEVYKLFGVTDRLQVRYPDCYHNFPPEMRQEAYRFIDRILNHIPRHDSPDDY